MMNRPSRAKLAVSLSSLPDCLIWCVKECLCVSSRDKTQIDEENIANTNTAPGPHPALQALQPTPQFVTETINWGLWRGLSLDDVCLKSGSNFGYWESLVEIIDRDHWWYL